MSVAVARRPRRKRVTLPPAPPLRPRAADLDEQPGPPPLSSQTRAQLLASHITHATPILPAGFRWTATQNLELAGMCALLAVCAGLWVALP